MNGSQQAACPFRTNTRKPYDTVGRKNGSLLLSRFDAEAKENSLSFVRVQCQESVVPGMSIAVI